MSERNSQTTNCSGIHRLCTHCQFTGNNSCACLQLHRKQRGDENRASENALMVTLFLFRFTEMKYALSVPMKGGPQVRVSSAKGQRSIVQGKK